MERQLKKRQRGEAVRIEFEAGTSRFMQRFMTQEMHLAKEDLYEIDGPLDMTMFFSFCGIKATTISAIRKRIRIAPGP